MKFVKNVFGKKEVSKLESLQSEAQINSGAVQEEQAKQARLKDGLRLIEIELEVAGSDKELLKRKKRIEQALEESVSRQSEAQKRLEELNAEIADLKVTQERQRLIDIAEQDAQGFELAYRAGRLEEVMNKLKYKTQPLTGNAGSGNPHRLLKDAGVKAGYFNDVAGSHAQHHEIWSQFKDEAKERVDSELEVLIEAIETFLAQDKK
ncbi:hypothetical protein [Gracilibacillus lacisalsi]|uniref:hypothetical protein n=1 Tax=Gracilibacillus lacisalsi TaxID=393087 RepID=UPI00037A5166|nr:hypothetical protein [Gracilibacillus lacisalsi]